MLTSIKCNLKFCEFCDVCFYTSGGNFGNAICIWYMIQAILICYLPTRHPWKAGYKLLKLVCVLLEDFQAVKKQRVKISQAVNFFLKFTPLLNFEEIMQSIFIFSYQNAYQKESFWLNSTRYIWSFPALPRFPFVL